MVLYPSSIRPIGGASVQRGEKKKDKKDRGWLVDE